MKTRRATQKTARLTEGSLAAELATPVPRGAKDQLHSALAADLDAQNPAGLAPSKPLALEICRAARGCGAQSRGLPAAVTRHCDSRREKLLRQALSQVTTVVATVANLRCQSQLSQNESLEGPRAASPPAAHGAAAHPPTGQALAQGVSPGWPPPDPPTTGANRFAMATQSDP